MITESSMPFYFSSVFFLFDPQAIAVMHPMKKPIAGMGLLYPSCLYMVISIMIVRMVATVRYVWGFIVLVLQVAAFDILMESLSCQ